MGDLPGALPGISNVSAVKVSKRTTMADAPHVAPMRHEGRLMTKDIMQLSSSAARASGGPTEAYVAPERPRGRPEVDTFYPDVAVEADCVHVPNTAVFKNNLQTPTAEDIQCEDDSNKKVS